MHRWPELKWRIDTAEAREIKDEAGHRRDKRFHMTIVL
jgi:hypothetical protein